MGQDDSVFFRVAWVIFGGSVRSFGLLVGPWASRGAAWVTNRGGLNVTGYVLDVTRYSWAPLGQHFLVFIAFTCFYSLLLLLYFLGSLGTAFCYIVS